MNMRVMDSNNYLLLDSKFFICILSIHASIKISHYKLTVYGRKGGNFGS